METINYKILDEMAVLLFDIMALKDADGDILWCASLVKCRQFILDQPAMRKAYEALIEAEK